MHGGVYFGVAEDLVFYLFRSFNRTSASVRAVSIVTGTPSCLHFKSQKIVLSKDNSKCFVTMSSVDTYNHPAEFRMQATFTRFLHLSRSSGRGQLVEFRLECLEFGC